MQTDFLFKQLNSSLNDLKGAIEEFEKHSSPSNKVAEHLFHHITQTNKLVSTYLILKQYNEVDSEVGVNFKTSNIISPVEILEIAKSKLEEPNEINEDKKVILEPIQTVDLKTELIENINLPKLNININDKFRFINELFSGNANEYQMAIEQLNATTNKLEANVFLDGLKNIYAWKEENELVKSLMSLVAKRF